MLRDLWGIALKSLMSRKFHAALNIAGLAIGFAAAILLSLYVHDEATYDAIFPADTYRISSTIRMPGGHSFVFDGTDYAAAEGMRLPTGNEPPSHPAIVIMDAIITLKLIICQCDIFHIKGSSK